MARSFNSERLRHALKASDERLKPYRMQRRSAIKQHVGRYGGAEDAPDQPINLVKRQVTVLAAHLAAAQPEHRVRTEHKHLRLQALTLQLALDRLADEVDRATLSRRMLLEGLLGPSMQCRVGVRAGAELHTVGDRTFDPGLPYVDPVSLDDFYYDSQARHDGEALFMGHRYRSSRAMLLETEVFGKEHADLIRSLPGLGEASERAESITGGGEPRDDKQDTIELIDVAVYESGFTRLITVPAEGSDQFLRDMEWEGFEGGPYIRHVFYPTLDSPWGVPPIASSREQGELINDALVKLSRQIEALKVVLLARADAAKTAEEIRKADPNKIEVIRTQDPAGVKAEVIGAINHELWPFAQSLLGLWDQEHNINLLGGADPKSDSATEAALRSSNSGIVVSDLTAQHEKFELRISRALEFYLRTDPFRRLPLIHRLPGGERIHLTYTPDMVEDEHAQHTMRVELVRGSMTAAKQNPDVRSRRIIELLTSLGNLASVNAALQQSGAQVRIDLGAVARVLSREFGIEELDEVIDDGGASDAIDQAIFRALGQPPAPPQAGPIRQAPSAPLATQNSHTQPADALRSAFAGVAA